MPIDGAVSVAVSPSIDCPQTEPASHKAVMRRAYVLPGVTVNIIRFLDQALEEGHSLAAYSDPQIARLADCSIKTAGRIRGWLKTHNFLCPNRLTGSREDTGTSLSVCLLSKSKHLLKPEQQHVDKAVQLDELAQKKLDEIGFMRFGGKIPWKERDVRLEAWIERYGAVNVLYGLWLVEMRRQPTVNAAGYVRSLVEGEMRAPTGWMHPEILAKEAEAEARSEGEEERAAEPPQIQRTRVDEGRYTPETKRLLRALSGRLRPVSVERWFSDSFISDIEDEFVILSLPDAVTLDWIEEHYQALLTQLLGKSVRLVI